jgi:hypothetical protein
MFVGGRRPWLLIALPIAGVAFGAAALAGVIPGMQRADAGGWSVSKVADADSALDGDGIGFTITIKNHESSSNYMYVSDQLPGGPGVNWMIASAVVSADPLGSGGIPIDDCVIMGSPPFQTLRCEYEQSGMYFLQVRVISDTTSASCGPYPNTAYGSVGGVQDAQANAQTYVECTTPTPTPTPKPDGVHILGGTHDGGGNVVVIMDPAQIIEIRGFDVPNAGCLPPVFHENVPIVGGQFSYQNAAVVSGTTGMTDGRYFITGNMSVQDGVGCTGTVDYRVDEGAEIQGDVDCGWKEGLSVMSVPLGADLPADPANSVTPADALQILRETAKLPVTQHPDCPKIGGPDPTVTPAGTPSPTPVPSSGTFAGDVDCDGSSNAADALKVLQYLSQLEYQSPATCVKVGKFYLSPR